MMEMFYGASAFNQNIGRWNVGSVTYMNYMFYQASAFNQNLCPWRDKIPSIPNTNIFTSSGCTYTTTPSLSNGPFCTVETCPSG